MKKGVKITVGVLGVGLIFGLGIGGGYYLATKNNQYNKDTAISKPSQNNEQSKEEAKKQEVKQLTKADVETLYNYMIKYKDNGEAFEDFFSNTKVTFETLTTEFKETLAYNKTSHEYLWDRNAGYKKNIKNSKLSDKLQNEILKYPTMEKYLESEFGNSYEAIMLVIDTNYTEINNTYKKIFGQDKNMKLENKTFVPDSCQVKYNDLLCVTFEGGTAYSNNDMRFGSAEKIDNTINIYSYYLILDNNNNLEYSDLETLSDTEYKKYAKKYKSVFKEDSDGNYYWYSTEPVEE